MYEPSAQTYHHATAGTGPKFYIAMTGALVNGKTTTYTG